MLKNKSKLMIIFLMIITMFVLLTGSCFATQEENNTTAQDQNGVQTTDETTTEPISEDETSQAVNSNIHQGDLYVVNSDITMDQLVNGNVYLFGNNIKITGQVAGNVYAFGNTITVDKSYIQASAYLFANEINFAGVTNDVYAACRVFTVPTDCGVYRDLRVTADQVNMQGIVGRDAHISANTITLEKDNVKGTIYGNLNYNSNSEIAIPDGSVEGTVSFNQVKDQQPTMKDKVLNYVYAALATAILTAIVFLVYMWLAPKATEAFEKAISKKWYISIGMGVLAFIIVPIASIILMITRIGLPVGMLLLGIYMLFLALSTATLSIAVGSIFTKKVIKSEKKAMALLMAVVASLILWTLNLIPMVGGFIFFLAMVFGFGSLITSVCFRQLLSGKAKKEVVEKKK